MKELRINGKIHSREVVVIGEDKESFGVVPISKALELAKAADLDLVEVAPGEKPPVCRIMDYGKYKYKQNKKEHDSKKKQKIIHIKEIKLRPKTEEHDFQFKLNHIKRFLECGDKAKVTVNFRGREAKYTHLGQEVLERIIKELENFGTVEQQPKCMGKTMNMVLIPKAHQPSVSPHENEKKETSVNKEASVNKEISVKEAPVTEII